MVWKILQQAPERVKSNRRQPNVRHPAEMGAPEVQAFLTHLAVEWNVVASFLEFVPFYYNSGYGCFTQRNPKYAGLNCFALGHTFPS